MTCSGDVRKKARSFVHLISFLSHAVDVVAAAAAAVVVVVVVDLLCSEQLPSSIRADVVTELFDVAVCIVRI